MLACIQDLMQICNTIYSFTRFLMPSFLRQVECAVHNPEPHINTESTADTPVVGHGCVWVRSFACIPKKKHFVCLSVSYIIMNRESYFHCDVI